MNLKHFLFFTLALLPLNSVYCFEMSGFRIDDPLWREMSSEFNWESIQSPMAVAGKKYEKRTKQFYLDEAAISRRKANYYLNEADKYSSLLPEISAKENLKTVIASAIGTCAVKNPKEKLLVISLAVVTELASIGIDTADNFLSLRKNLSLAAAKLEEFNYYSKLALSSALYTEIEEFDDLMETICPMMEDAIQWLIIADMYTTALEMKCGTLVSSYIYDVRELLIKDIEKNGIPTIRHSNNISFLLENLDEIFSICGKNDQYFKDVARTLLIQSYKTLKEVEVELLSCDKMEYLDDDEEAYYN